MARAKKQKETNFNRIPIDVTQEDIDRGHRAHSGKCMGARAIAGTVPTANRIDVDFQTIKFTSGMQRYEYLTPPALAAYVADYDGGREIVPFSFILKNPRISTRQIRSTNREFKATTSSKLDVKTTGETEAKGSKKSSFEYRDANGRKPAPTTYKGKERSYGARRMVMNQLSANEKERIARQIERENAEKEAQERAEQKKK